jgi:ParB family chromosome partitioning protein
MTQSNPAKPKHQNIPVALCRPHQANRNVRDEDLTELADSIRAVGIINPIHVRVSGDGFEIIAGERRWRASRLAGLELISAFVHETCQDITADTLRVVENDQRCDPTALDTARELRRIKNLYGLTHDGVAQQTGIAVNRVKKYLALFAASDSLLEAFDKHRLPPTAALLLARFEKEHGEAKTRTVLRKFVAGEMTTRDLELLRKRKGAAPTENKAPPSPWKRLEARATNLIDEDPDAAKGPLQRLHKRLQQKLKNDQDAA